MRRRESSTIGTGLGPTLARSVGFELLGGGLAQDVRKGLRVAIKDGVVFERGSTPLEIFRQSLAAAIGKIHCDGRAELFLRFLKEGPYEGEGEIPRRLRGKRLTTEETASVISFISGHMISCFQGAIMEMLAVYPCLKILHRLQREGRLSRRTRLYVGDAVKARQSQKSGFAKGADLHFLAESSRSRGTPSVEVCGVAEVKSYFPRTGVIGNQLEKHVIRAQRGVRVQGREFGHSQITIARDGKPLRISILPDDWRLSRKLGYVKKDGKKFLEPEPSGPEMRDDKIEPLPGGQWKITLRWSREAIAATAYEMTFWFMEMVGEALYSEGVPKEWSKMSPAEAGRNAAKMMLYYAIQPYVLKEQDKVQLKHKEKLEKQRAIALYNCYGFGYSLGMNFRDGKGHRKMLWPEDLDEIQATGKTKDGCRICT